MRISLSEVEFRIKSRVIGIYPRQDLLSRGKCILNFGSYAILYALYFLHS